MSDDELQQVIGKVRRLKALRRAKERVRQLERELCGAPAKPEESPWVPEFLRRQVSSGPAPLNSAEGQRLADNDANHPTRAVSQLRSARRSRIPFGRRSAGDLAEWRSASRGPLAEPWRARAGSFKPRPS
jgi:hypothetical protein